MTATFVTAAEVIKATGLPADYSVIAQADIEQHIGSAEAYLQQILNVSFTTGTSTAVVVTDETYDGDATDTFFIKKVPVNSITALSVTDDYGASYTTITTGTKIWTDSQTGMVRLKPTAEATRYPKGTQTIKVSYKHGIVPDEGHKRLMCLLAGIMTLVEQAGGTFDDVTNYSLPEYTVSKGEPYTNIREATLRLREEWDRLITYYRPKLSMA